MSMHASSFFTADAHSPCDAHVDYTIGWTDQLSKSKPSSRQLWKALAEAGMWGIIQRNCGHADCLRLWLTAQGRTGLGRTTTRPCVLSREEQLRGLRRKAGAVAQAEVWRPTLQDVESLSRGDAAKERGTGSRQIPHRLNADERKIYDIAKSKAWLSSCALFWPLNELWLLQVVSQCWELDM